MAKTARPGCTPQMERFAQEYVKSGNATDAYAIAYPRASRRSAGEAGSRLLKTFKVAERVKELSTAVAAKNAIDAEWVLRGLVRNYERAMQAEPVLDREGNETGTFTYEGAVANRSLELIGKTMALFTDGLRVDLSKMSEAELEALARGSRPAGD